MNVYEISNPSDAYTIAGEPEAVCAAVLLLGEGAYGVSWPAGATVLPVYAFWGDGLAEEDWKSRFGRTIGESLRALREPITAALETVMIGTAADRARMEAVLAAIASPEERERARAAWHDGRRSSTNDIGRRAGELAKALRAKPAAEG